MKLAQRMAEAGLNFTAVVEDDLDYDFQQEQELEHENAISSHSLHSLHSSYSPFLATGHLK